MELETMAPGKCWWSGTAHPSSTPTKPGKAVHSGQGYSLALPELLSSTVPVLLPLESYMNAANANLSRV